MNSNGRTVTARAAVATRSGRARRGGLRTRSSGIAANATARRALVSRSPHGVDLTWFGDALERMQSAILETKLRATD